MKNFITKNGKKIKDVIKEKIKFSIINKENKEIIIWPEIILIVNRRIKAIGWINILINSINTIKKDNIKGHPNGQRCSKKEEFFLI